MRWLRVLVAAGGVGLTAWALLAWVIDQEGLAPRVAYRVDAQEVVVVLGARVDADGTASPTLRARVEHARAWWALREVPAMVKDLLATL